MQALIALYNGTLLTLAVAPAGTVTAEATLALARCLVAGVLQAVLSRSNEWSGMFVPVIVAAAPPGLALTHPRNKKAV